MKKIIIDDDITTTTETDNVIYINDEGIKEIIELTGILNFVSTHILPEDWLLENISKYDVPLDIIFDSQPLSENFIKAALLNGLMVESNISDLSILTYSNLSNQFIDKYSEYIDWKKLILYLSSTDNIDFDKYLSVIEKCNLWYIISANQLPIDFIRAHKDKLSWDIVSITNFFTEEELEEFKSYIPENKQVNFSIPVDISLKEISKIINLTSVLDSESSKNQEN